MTMIDWKKVGHGENLEARAIVDRMVAELEAGGVESVETPHVLISHGLYMLAATECTPHLLEQLIEVRDFVNECIENTKREMS